MKSILVSIVAAVVLMGCGESALDISIHDAAEEGNVEAVKQHLADGTDVNAKNQADATPLDYAEGETADLLRKHGSKRGRR